jgi:protein-disulfide isomerase
MSKKDERRQRRQAQTRTRQVQLIAGIIILAVGVVAWLIWQNTRPLAPITPIATQPYPQANGKTLGAADAPVQVLLFSDFQCPVCKDFADNYEPQIITQFVDTGRIRLEYHHYLIIDYNQGGNESRDAAEASECASDQGQFWNFHDLLYANQGAEASGAFEPRRLKAAAASLGLDTATFDQCFDSNRHAGDVTADEALAAQYGVQGTPTIFINGGVMTDFRDLDEWERRISLQEQQ